MRRILILDDEPAVLNALRRTLRTAFPPAVMEIETFDEPEAALLRAGEQDFDVVISDYRMPGLNGAEVLRLVKGMQPEAIRIVVSATTEFNDIMAAVNRAEVFRYLVKPWQREELIATIREALERRDVLVRARPQRPAVRARDKSAEELARLLRDRALQALEKEEPGITRVDWDENGNVRLF
jgi:DNA-binding NtrC family response regulator